MFFNCKKLFVYAVSLYTWGSKVGDISYYAPAAQKVCVCGGGVISPCLPRVAPLVGTALLTIHYNVPLQEAYSWRF